ncbi:MAG TPA: hypothetical protein PKE19_03455 [Aestuariivirga sp.]|nr:hypothetical protein [Aestuariivirga sp.]
MRNDQHLWRLARAATFRLVLLLPMLQIALPGVLAHSARPGEVWCVTLAGPKGSSSPGAPARLADGDCLICMVTAPGNSPLPAAICLPTHGGTPGLGVPPVVFADRLASLAARDRPPIRAPPRLNPLVSCQPRAVQGCALIPAAAAGMLPIIL